MLFGDQSTFAIETYRDSEMKLSNGVWGRMCVWCDGVALGDIEEARCALYPAYCAFRALPRELEHLWAEELSELDDVAVWNLFVGPHVEAWERFRFLDNWGEQFDACRAFMICPPEGPVCILFAQAPDHVLRSARASRGEVMAAVEGFTRWFEQQTPSIDPT